jgi:LacI family transcriptional regulator
MYNQQLDVLVSIVPKDEDATSWATKLLAQGRIDALAVVFDRIQQIDPHAMAALPVPAVLVNYTPTDSSPPAAISAVGYDNQIGTEQALRYLISLGHKRIAFLGATADWPDAIERENAFRRTMSDAGLHVPEDWVARCYLMEGETIAAREVDRMFATGANPTAIVCAHDNLARGAYVSARRWGKSIPEDLSITGHYDAQGADFWSPPLTSVQQPGWDLGVAVGQLLLKIYRGELTEPTTIKLPTQLIIRESVGPAKP